jgi:SAM-dependent methyltransferase
MPDPRAARRLNRAYRDSRASRHPAGAARDDAAVLAGEDTLGELESAGIREAAGAVAGLDVLHLQCDAGHDTISLARRGARVTGVDVSRTALDRARELARRAAVTADFAEADASALPPALHGRFDLAFAAPGALSWIDDLPAWIRSAAAALRPGGRLLVVDVHPVCRMFAAADPPVLRFPYADDGGRSDEATQTVRYAHGLGELVTSAVHAGLRVEHLDEHLEAAADPHDGVLARGDDGRYRLRLDGELLPVAFTFIARRA